MVYLSASRNDGVLILQLILLDNDTTETIIQILTLAQSTLYFNIINMSDRKWISQIEVLSNLNQ